MDKTERLLDLIAFFLDAREPIPWRELREAFPDEYGKGTDDACERKFERDKSDLAELGITLEWGPGGEDTEVGYVLSRDGYYLPEIGLTPEEVAVLFAAGSSALASGAFPGRSDLAHALRKVTFASPEDPEASPRRVFAELERGGGRVGQHLDALWQALLSRKRVELLYRAAGTGEETRRQVDPYGLCLRRGAWVLVGHCYLRGAERTFHVDRIVEARVNPAKPKSPDYEVPDDFHVERVAAEQVWEHRFHEPLEVRVGLAPHLLSLAERILPGSRPAEGGVVVSATFLDGLLRHLLSLGVGVRVLGPERATSRLGQLLGAVQRAHAPGADGGSP